MSYEGLVACICEGGAERTIIKILLDKDLLKFSNKQLLDGEILGRRDRSAKNFEKNHLRKSFEQKITIVRILDSYGEAFELSKLYKDKVQVVNVITAPEIEMLVIIKENKYKEYQKVKSSKKPSEFCKEVLGINDVKSPEFIEEYFADTQVLINTLRKYKSMRAMRAGEQCIADLLK